MSYQHPTILFSATALAPSCRGLGKMLPRIWQGRAKGFERLGTPQVSVEELIPPPLRSSPLEGDSWFLRLFFSIEP